MSNQYAITDQNRTPALTGHSGTANNAEVRRIVVNEKGGLASDVVDLDVLVDDYTTGSFTYIGRADPGASTGSAVWQIRGVDETGDYPTIKYAGGTSSFDLVWDDRVSYSY